MCTATILLLTGDIKAKEEECYQSYDNSELMAATNPSL